MKFQLFGRASIGVVHPESIEFSYISFRLVTVLVAPMKTKGFAAPFRVPVTHARTKGLIVLDQIRAVDKIRRVNGWARSTPKPCLLS